MSKPRKAIRGHKNSCSKKQRFETQYKASEACRFGLRGGAMIAYRCKKCRFWHYGHPSPRNYKAGAFTQP